MVASNIQRRLVEEVGWFIERSPWRNGNKRLEMKKTFEVGGVEPEAETDLCRKALCWNRTRGYQACAG